jgi:hypothetical protein
MKEAVKRHMVSISSNNDRHRVSRNFTPLHYTCRHFTSSNLNFTQLQFTTLLLLTVPQVDTECNFYRSVAVPSVSSISSYTPTLGHFEAQQSLHTCILN